MVGALQISYSGEGLVMFKYQTNVNVDFEVQIYCILDGVLTYNHCPAAVCSGPVWMFNSVSIITAGKE